MHVAPGASICKAAHAKNQYNVSHVIENISQCPMKGKLAAAGCSSSPQIASCETRASDAISKAAAPTTQADFYASFDCLDHLRKSCLWIKANTHPSAAYHRERFGAVRRIISLF
jgi:hypothetical protein